jgi:hypothetical protein
MCWACATPTCDARSRSSVDLPGWDESKLIQQHTHAANQLQKLRTAETHRESSGEAARQQAVHVAACMIVGVLDWTSLQVDRICTHMSPLSQVLFFIPAVRKAMLSIIPEPEKEFSLSCEMSLLFRMLYTARGSVCQASNLFRSVQLMVCPC